MKTLMIVIALAAVSVAAVGASAKDVYVQGYEKKDGTYVDPYYRTAPNSNSYDNYSTKGNVNPYTGKEGTKSPDDRYSGYKPAPDTAPLFGRSLSPETGPSPGQSGFGGLGGFGQPPTNSGDLGPPPRGYR